MKINKIDFRNNSIPEVEELLFKNGFNKDKINNFKKQFKTQKINSIIELTGVKEIKKISGLIPFQSLKLHKSFKDSTGNEKFVFKTNDDFFIESVFMPKVNSSICVSVQIRCKFGCMICNTGRMGFKRNLLTHEILEQIRFIFQNRIFPGRLSCVSFMGMGEPFDNLEKSMLAMEWINSSWGYQISRFKINFSTSGAVPFNKFLSYKNIPNLAVSLHSSNENVRRNIFPKSKINIKKLKENMIQYTQKTGKQITIEYCLIKGINDGVKDAFDLTAYLKGLSCKINLLNYNKIPGSIYEPSELESINNFKKILKEKNIPAIYRKSLGKEIFAGCGQLGGKYN